MKVSPFTPGSDQQGSAPNPSDDDYRRKFDEGNFEERLKDTPSQDDIAKGLDDLENLANGKRDATPKPVREQESSGDHTIPSTFSGKGATKVVGKMALKKAAPFIGGGGIIGIIIFLIGGWLPTMLVPGLAQGSIAENDSRSTVLERRLLAKLKTKMADTSGPCATKTAICLNKKMPKNMLSSMESHGIKPLNGDQPIDTKGGGYVDKNPTHYQFTDSNGKLKTIAAGDFLNEYKNNPVFRKTFKKAWNMRYVSYASNFMRKALGKWGVKPDGGKAADSNFTEKTAVDDTAKAVKAKGGSTDEEGAKKTFRDRAKQLFKRAADKTKKSGGDPVLMVGSGVCMMVAMPTFVAGTVRAVQLAQVAVLASDFVLSAGDMIRSGDAKPEQTAALGNTLQARYTDPETKQMKAAVDSPILLAATGAATQSILKPNNLMPGYGMFSSSFIRGAGDVNKALKEPCNLINSPQAALASAAITAGIGAASAGIGAVVIKGLQAIAKVAMVFGAIDLLMKGLEESGVLNSIGDFAFSLAKDAIGNIYEDAKGIQLGDALGAGIFAVLSLGSLAGGAAVLTKAQAGSFQKVMGAVDDEYKQEDIATLSPFDTSSRYTFLGSIASKLAISSAGSSNMVTSTLSTIGAIVKSPLQLLGGSASAAVDPVEAKFGYASYYGVDDNIGVTVAGTPATGIPTEYLDMDTTTAENLVSNSFDPSTGAPYKPEAVIGIQTNNSDITNAIADCADADLETMSGCTIQSSSSATVNSTITDKDGKSTTSQVTIDGDKTAEQSAAERIYYMDYGLERVLNGEDAADKAGGATDSIAGATIDMANLFNDSASVACAPGTTEIRNDTGYTNGSPVPIKLCSIQGTLQGGSDGTFPAGKAGAPGMANSRVSGAALAMFTKMKTDLGLSEVPLNDSFRTNDEQAANVAKYGGQAAAAGYSNHQMGIAFDMGGGGCSYSKGVTSCSSSAIWNWLTANAASYGFKQLSDEWWHWSPTGG